MATWIGEWMNMMIFRNLRVHHRTHIHENSAHGSEKPDGIHWDPKILVEKSTNGWNVYEIHQCLMKSIEINWQIYVFLQSVDRFFLKSFENVDISSTKMSQGFLKSVDRFFFWNVHLNPLIHWNPSRSIEISTPPCLDLPQPTGHRSAAPAASLASAMLKIGGRSIQQQKIGGKSRGDSAMFYLHVLLNMVKSY